MCRRRLEELIDVENNFVFNAFLNLEPVQQFENMVRIGGPGSCNDSRAFWMCIITAALNYHRLSIPLSMLYSSFVFGGDELRSVFN